MDSHLPLTSLTRALSLWAGTCLTLLVTAAAEEDFPVHPDSLEVSLFARDPLVRNPCALAFDARGRLCVGMGPQYRKPAPDTPGDSVWILTDTDADGAADHRLEFATGFNAIQGLAWRGHELWVANAPDLTVVRDTDGDDIADEYVRLYTDLGNLEHGLHGLQWAPDGFLYMSKGNSKGLNQSTERLAPLPFRQLWGMPSLPNAPDLPPPARFDAASYQRNYHDPSDDWGLSGGILRCLPDGSGLEIVARGFRNPWDIAYDDHFDWLGTDNDQNQGDKFFSPFYDAHFGWGHSWSYAWEGSDHLPTVPSSGPLFEGSGTGVLWLGLPEYPQPFRNVFLVNDWLRREVYVFRPRWEGAWMQAHTHPLPLFAHADGGRSMGQSDGRRFDPVDVELGPDGAVYIGSWGRQYGAEIQGSEMQNEGRIYRFYPRDASPRVWSAGGDRDPWSDLDSHLPIWRVNAQIALITRGTRAVPRLQSLLTQASASVRLQTWAAWTLGRIGLDDPDIDAFFAGELDHSIPLNRRLQALRILAHRSNARQDRRLPAGLLPLLESPEARLRHQTVLALRQIEDPGALPALVQLADRETDRIVYYSTWQALRHLMPRQQLQNLLDDSRPGVRLGATLALLEDDALDKTRLARLAQDAHPPVAALARRRLGGKAETVIKGPALEAPGAAPPPEPALAPLSVATNLQSFSGRPYQLATLTNGAPAYLDRSYRLRQVPTELTGLTFILTANDDADAQSGTGFRLTLPYPSTIYLADDARGTSLPRWARERFQPTPWEMHNGDAPMRIHEADFPAGEASFGANRDDVEARKSHYLVIIQPHLLAPPDTPPTAEAVLDLLPHADPEKGRTLFLSPQGATCVTCHEMEGRGNLFAPDLSDIATRADAAFLTRAILEPSADITEGFAMQMVTTRQEGRLGGIILEETARHLLLVGPDGSQHRIAQDDVISRETAPISAMPPLAPLLQAQQVADLVAYLLTKGQVTSGAAPTNKTLQPAAQSWGHAEDGFHLHLKPDRLEITLRSVAIMNYHYAHEQTRRPFFAHVKTPGGRQITRSFPPVEGRDPTDHAFMHPGLSLGFAILNEENFWHNDRGTVRHHAFLSEPRADADSAAFAVRNHYHDRHGNLLCQEDAHYRLQKNQDGYLLLIDTAFSSEKPLSFGVREEMGLAFRVASPLRVKDGQGRILASHGGRNEEGTWGKTASWWDYAGGFEDHHIGGQIISAPSNPPVWAHSRDYGVLVANPFPVDIAENRDRTTTVDPGDTFRLQFGFQVHEHPSAAEYDPAQAAHRYFQQLSQTP